jgi:hypothetical protein
MHGEWQEWQEYGRPRRWALPSDVHDPPRSQWFNRIPRDLHVVLQNELETRRFLAEEVYGVPDAWLDEVLRVRLADLIRSARH